MSRRRALSLQARLLAGMAVVAVVLVTVSIVIAGVTRAQLVAQVDQRLEAFSPGDGGRTTSPGGRPRPPGDWPERASDVYEGYVALDGILVTRFDPNIGDYSAPTISVADLPESGQRFFTTGSVRGDHTYRVLAQRHGDVVAITALPLDDVQSTISRLVLVEVVGALAILATLGVVAWWVLRLGIGPIKSMTRTAGRIADGDLEVRVPESPPGTESGELASALNRMLATLGGALDERAATEARLRRFVADASHELRTPVTTIRGYAELHRHGGLDEPDALTDAMRRTEQEAVRMGRLVDDMLLLARLDQQRPLERREVDVLQLVHDATADARATAIGRSIRLETAAKAGDVPLVVSGDEDGLRQVLANVVGNALVHTTDDVEVVLRARRDGAQVVVEVEDHGEGMSPEVAAQATERFVRADKARPRHRGGSGLGLSIAEAIVHAHDGTLTIDSTPGRGTTVRLSFPAA